MTAARERGSALMLVPAAVLVLFLLGAVAVDSAVAVLGQRELSAAASAAANDAVAAALSDARFYGHEGGDPGAVVVDQAAAQRVAAEALRRMELHGVEPDGDPVVTVVDHNQVCVRISGRVRAVFGLAIPGASQTHAVRGRATATAVRAGADGASEAIPRARDC